MTRRNDKREDQHQGIEHDLPGPRQAFGVGGEQRTESAKAEGGAERSTDQREHDALRQELPQEAPPTRAERRPDGELALARFGPSEHQVRQVGAGDE